MRGCRIMGHMQHKCMHCFQLISAMLPSWINHYLNTENFCLSFFFTSWRWKCLYTLRHRESDFIGLFGPRLGGVLMVVTLPDVRLLAMTSPRLTGVKLPTLCVFVHMCVIATWPGHPVVIMQLRSKVATSGLTGVVVKATGSYNHSVSRCSILRLCVCTGVRAMFLDIPPKQKKPCLCLRACWVSRCSSYTDKAQLNHHVPVKEVERTHTLSL